MWWQGAPGRYISIYVTCILSLLIKASETHYCMLVCTLWILLKIPALWNWPEDRHWDSSRATMQKETPMPQYGSNLGVFTLMTVWLFLGNITCCLKQVTCSPFGLLLAVSKSCEKSYHGLTRTWYFCKLQSDLLCLLYDIWRIHQTKECNMLNSKSWRIIRLNSAGVTELLNSA